jgi:hypothetical protein
MRQEFGGRIYRKAPSTPEHRAQYQWDVWGKEARGCVEAVIPYLIEKGPQAALLLDYLSWPRGSEKRRAIERELKRLKRTNYE